MHSDLQSHAVGGTVHFQREQGDRIRQARTAAGLSIPDLAKVVGISPGAVSHWETGRHLPRRHRQVSIAEAVGASWVELFGNATSAADV